MTYKQIFDKLQSLKGRWPEIAIMANVPYRTLKKVADGTTRNPSCSTLERIDVALKRIR